MYSEEVDLCYRLRDAGWQVHFAPVTNVTHMRYASTNQQRADMKVWLFRSRIHFYRRHYTRLRLRLFKAVVAYIGLRSLALGALRLRCKQESLDRALLLEDMAIQKRVLAVVFREATRRT
jgi:GT2 family glycosyltransferase